MSEPLSSPASPPETDDAPSNFVRDIIDEDLEKDTHDGRVVTRFPPEPNGYLHIGHAKSIVLNFGIAEDYAARGADTTCRLRFDDTNPTGESEAYARSIEDAVHWLGYEPDEVRHASDYFERFYEYAVTLVEKGLAYVDSQSEEEIRENRGTVTEPGRESPYRDRSVDENLDLLRRMKAGEFADGAHVLRAKIDMASEHMIMRDPLLYRIRHIEHYRRGDDWCIYPMYDFAHCLEDAIENVTHSLCTLEFANNRRIYDWILENALPEDQLPQRPHQYEFNRLNLTYTVLSKRKLRRLIEDGAVDGWDDPRLFTLAGLRRRGVPPSAIRQFCRAVGVTRSPGRVQISRFEHAETGVGIRLSPAEPSTGTGSGTGPNGESENEYQVSVGADGAGDPGEMDGLADASDHADALGTAREFMERYNEHCLNGEGDLDDILAEYEESEQRA